MSDLKPVVKDMCVFKSKTQAFLEYHYSDESNLAEKCIRACKDGYEMFCLKSSVRMHESRLNDKDKRYIYRLFDVPLPDYLKPVITSP